MSKKKTNDLNIKVFALLIAILLWAYVMKEVNPEIIKEYKNIDLEFSNVESLDKEGLKLMSPQESKISVRVLGKKSDLDSGRFSAKNIKALVDLRGYTEGQKKVPVKVNLENQMSNIEIIDYEPKEVMITFDKFITTESKITIRTVGELPESYVMGEVKISPETVLLKGPRSYIKEISDVVAYIDLDNRKKSGKATASVRLLNDQGNDLIGVDKDPTVVSAEIAILRSRQATIQPRFNKPLPEDISDLIVSPNKIKIKGDETVLDIGYVSTEPIDVDQLINKKYVKVDLSLPKGVEKLDSKEVVKISLNEKEPIEKTIALTAKNIDPINLGKDLKIDSNLNLDFSIIVKGDDIDRLNNEDIRLKLDLSGLGEGEHDLKVTPKLPSGFEVISLTPDNIRVKLAK